MAEGKKSFVLYADLIHTVELLPMDLKARLFQMILDYVNDKNPTTEDFTLRLAFEPIKQQLKRDLKDWEEKRVRRATAGHEGGLKSGEVRRKQNEANEASASDAKQTKQVLPAEAVNVSVSVSANDNVTVTLPAAGGFEEFWKAYPKKKAKQDAQKAWKKLKPGAELVEKMIVAIKEQIKTPDWNRENGRFIPLPASWLNQNRWDDQTEVPVFNKDTTHSSASIYDHIPLNY